jgi:hypothetical protein
LWNNGISSGSSFTAYSEDAQYPVTAIYDTRLSRVYRTNSVASTEYVIVKPSTATRMYYAAILNHNIESTATVYIEGSATSSFGAAFSTTLAWSSYTMIGTISSTAAYAYWRARIVGNSTTNGYIQIGFLYLGGYLQLPGMKPDQEIIYETTAKISISDGGQAYGDDGYSFRAPKVNFQYSTAANKVEIQDMWAGVKNYVPIILHIWESSTEERPLYCVIDQTNVTFKRTDDYTYRWATSLQFREVF